MQEGFDVEYIFKFLFKENKTYKSIINEQNDRINVMNTILIGELYDSD